MSQVRESYGVDSDRVEGRRRAWRPVVAVMLIGGVVGGVIGGAYGASRPASHQASTAVSVLPDSSVDTQDPLVAPTVDATSFIQSQLVVLNGSQLSAAVQKTLALPHKPSVTSTQVGQSYVVQVTATAATTREALDVATATANAYSQQRVQQLTAAINASIAATTAQLTTVQKSLAAAQANTPVTQGLSPAENALQTEYERLLTVSSGLKLALPQVSRVVTVISPATLAQGTLSVVAKYLVGGVIVGMLVGLALLILTRRFVTRIRSVSDLAALGVPVLLPAQPRRSRRSRHGATAWHSQPGRLLAARFVAPESGPQSPVVVVGATPGVGCSYVAATIAAGMTGRNPVLLVLAAELLDSRAVQQLTVRTDVAGPVTEQFGSGGSTDFGRFIRPTTVPGVMVLPCAHSTEGVTSGVRRVLRDIIEWAGRAGWSVVVDAPALSESDIALDCASDGITALVAGRGVSRPAEVLSAVQVLDTPGQRFAGVVLNDVPRRNAPTGRHRSQPTTDDSLWDDLAGERDTAVFANYSGREAPADGSARGGGRNDAADENIPVKTGDSVGGATVVPEGGRRS